MRFVWGGLGLISVGLGVVGAFLPLLPTVPFMLLAAFCFARSSERLHSWLLNHPRFGSAVIDWQERGAISRRVKRVSTVAIAAVFALSFLVGVRLLIVAIQAVVLTGVLLFIWTRPDH